MYYRLNLSASFVNYFTRDGNAVRDFTANSTDGDDAFQRARHARAHNVEIPPMTDTIMRPIYIVRLRPNKHVQDHIRTLRWALKRLWRDHGLQALSIEEERS